MYVAFCFGTHLSDADTFLMKAFNEHVLVFVLPKAFFFST